MTARHLERAELEAGLDEIRRAPSDGGRLELIVRRPEEGLRQVVDEGELDVATGLVGDNWSTRGSRFTDDEYADMQLNIMNARSAALIAQQREHWPLAGDQLFIDLDLSGENLPAGTRLALGTAVIEVTAMPHRGCKKFVSRFGLDAMKFVNSPQGVELNLRGINAKVARSGVVRIGDAARKL
jgi:hypothetical protein